ncbi:MAG TPA: ABC transporter substrate-binding protein [Chloroflexota bacterium]|nr:ABC transporter substrate-binding protein [Chloroflexota bacterium]
MRRRLPARLALTLLGLVAACSSPAAAPAKPAAPTAGTQPPAAAAQAPAQAAPSAPAERQTVQAGYLSILAGTPVFIAEDRGYFAEQGFTVQYTPFDSGALMVAPLAAGQLDIIPAVPSPSLFNALARGLPMQAVAIQSSASTSALMVRKELWDSGEVRTLPDLRGRRVSFNVEGSPVDYALRNGFQKYGLSLQDVEVQRVSNTDTAPALANGATDAGILPEPGPVLIETRGIGVRLMEASDMVGDQTGSMLTIGPSMTARGDAVITRYLAAYLRGLRDTTAAIKDNHLTDPDVLAIVGKWTNLPADTISKAVTLPVDVNGRIDLDDVIRQQEFWVREGLVPTPVDLRQFVDYQYVDAARALLR